MPLLDYGSATLACLPAHLLDGLQLILKTAARLVFGSRKYDHATPLLRDLHWLCTCVPERSMFQLEVMVYHCWHGLMPPIFADELQRVADTESQHLHQTPFAQ